MNRIVMLVAIVSSSVFSMSTIKLDKDFTLNEIESYGYKYSLRLGFYAGENEPDIYEDDETLVSGGCTLILRSNTQDFPKGTFQVSEVKKTKPTANIMDNTSWGKIVYSNNEENSALLDIKCFSDGFHLWNPFSKRKVEKLLLDYVDIK